jgi:hypothetical protein
MARPKQHHYVTKAYLDGFLADGEAQLAVYGRGGRQFRRTPTDLACQRNYYALRRSDGTWDDSLEGLIGDTIESPGLPVLQKLASGKTRLSWQERDRLALLIAFQEMRTPATRERVRAFSRMLNERVLGDVRAANPDQTSIKITSEAGSSTVTLDEIVKSHENYCDDHSMEIHRSLVSASVKLSDYYKHMKFTVYYAETGFEFITTDAPVVRTFRESQQFGAGINRPDVEIRFPLTRGAFLVITHDLKFVDALTRASNAKRAKMLERIPEISIRRATALEVNDFNRAQARHAHRWLFAAKGFAWATEVLSQPSAAPTLHDLSNREIIHFQSAINYNPRAESVLH